MGVCMCVSVLVLLVYMGFSSYEYTYNIIIIQTIPIEDLRWVGRQAHVPF